MAISAKDIMALREKTGLPMMECKKALEEANGDEAAAIKILEKKGAAKAEKRSDRETKVGLVEAYSHDGRIGVLVQMGAESDFVTRNEEFKSLAHDIALQVAAMNPLYVSSDAVPAEEKEAKMKEYKESALAEGKPENIADKIAEGRLNSYFKEVSLLDQPFVKDQDKTINDLVNDKIAKIGEKITVIRFVRYAVGE